VKNFSSLQIVDANDVDRSVGATNDKNVTRREFDAVDGDVELGLTQDLTHAQVDDADDAVLAANDDQLVLGPNLIFVDCK